MPRHDLLPNARHLKSIHEIAQRQLDQDRSIVTCPWCGTECPRPLIEDRVFGRIYGQAHCPCGARWINPFDMDAPQPQGERLELWCRPVTHEAERCPVCNSYTVHEIEPGLFMCEGGLCRAEWMRDGAA